ncbi:MAG: rhodanese-like domain-containing protein [Planctomycetes bacterium]|nr:rhodanese-like domain-containing protein [Planctomycetota bacterium]
MLRRRYTLPVLLCALATLAAGARGFALDHTTDTLETVKKNLEEKKAVLVDVREQGEWDAGHLAGARHVPLSKLEADGAPAELIELPKDTILYGHCRSGGRALKAAAVLQKAGYDFRPLKQGYEDLVAAGFKKDDASAEKKAGEGEPEEKAKSGEEEKEKEGGAPADKSALPPC